jgi:hypothetical protein
MRLRIDMESPIPESGTRAPTGEPPIRGFTEAGSILVGWAAQPRQPGRALKLESSPSNRKVPGPPSRATRLNTSRTRESARSRQNVSWGPCSTRPPLPPRSKTFLRWPFDLPGDDRGKEPRPAPNRTRLGGDGRLPLEAPPSAPSGLSHRGLKACWTRAPGKVSPASPVVANW